MIVKEKKYDFGLLSWYRGFDYILKVCLDYSYFTNHNGELNLPDNERIKIKIITKKNGIQILYMTKGKNIKEIIINKLKNTQILEKFSVN